VADVLELPHFPQYDRMAEMYIGAGWVQAELDSQLPDSLKSLSELLSQFGLSKDFDRAAF
jgi:hypothetical protein